MRALLEGFNTPRPWQVGLLVAVLLASVGAVYFLHLRGDDPAPVASTQSTETEPGAYQGPQRQISTLGTLVFPNRTTLTFGSPGTVEEINVREGDRVEEGQVLARLDPTVQASLQQAIARSWVGLQDAWETLEKKGPSPVEVAQARTEVYQARMKLQDTLDDFEPTHAQELAEARRARADAEVGLELAQQELARYELGYVQGLAEARKARADAVVAVEQAQQELADFAPNYAHELALARKAKADAVVAVEQAQQALADFAPSYAHELALARKTRADAQAALTDAEDTLLDVQTYPGRPGPEEVERLRVEVAFRRSELRQADDGLTRLEQGPDLQQQEQLEATVELARSELAAAERSIADLQTQSSVAIGQVPPIDPAQAPPLPPEASSETTSETSVPELAALEAQVLLARTNLLDAEARLREFSSEEGAPQLELKESEVDIARETLVRAEERLTKLQEGPDQTAMDLKESEVALARERLAEVEENLTQLLDGPDPLEMAFLESQVAVAQLMLEQNLQRLERATLRATAGGLVSRVNVASGDLVNEDTVIVEISDPSVIEVEALVDEAEVLEMREGLPVSVTLPALPDLALTGTLSEVAPAVLGSQDVVAAYPIRIRLEVPEGVALKEGLSAIARIAVPVDPGT